MATWVTDPACIGLQRRWCVTGWEPGEELLVSGCTPVGRRSIHDGKSIREDLTVHKRLRMNIGNAGGSRKEDRKRGGNERGVHLRVSARVR